MKIMQPAGTFVPVNAFGLRLLSARSDATEAEVLLAPPVLFLGLALLKGASSGATRKDLARLLGTDESLAEEERERHVRHLHELLHADSLVCAENLLSANSHRPLSPSFLRRSRSIYGVQVEQDDTSLPLRLQSTLQARLVLPADQPILSLKHDHLFGLRFPTQSPHHAVYVFLPHRVPFWQGRRKTRQRLLGQLDPETWLSWQAALQTQDPGPSWQFPAVGESGNLELRDLDLGPASTAAANFSRLMVSGDAPHLSFLRHQTQLSVSVESEGEATRALPDQPLVWLLAEESTGLILTLGLQP